jgi:sugar-phosphatase
MINAVIFDMDGLLIDTEPEWQRLEIELFADLGLNISPKMQKETFGLRVDEMVKHWFDYKAIENTNPIDVINRIENLMEQYFMEEAELMEGTEYIIDFFRKKDMKMGLCSSSTTKLINAFINKFGFKECFQAISSAEKEKYGKPHPAAYLAAAEKLKVHPTSCLAFEDSLNGIIAAKAARMKVVAVPHEDHYEDKNLFLADLKLKSLLEFNEEEFEWLRRDNS